MPDTLVINLLSLMFWSDISLVKPWPHRASAAALASALALTLASMLENGYEASAWCWLYRHKLMWAITSVNSDVDDRCGQGLKLVVPCLSLRNKEEKFFIFLLKCKFAFICVSHTRNILNPIYFVAKR